MKKICSCGISRDSTPTLTWNSTPITSSGAPICSAMRNPSATARVTAMEKSCTRSGAPGVNTV